MSTASKSDRERLAKSEPWRFGDLSRRLWLIEEQGDINNLPGRLTSRNYSQEYKGMVLARCIAAAKRIGLRLPPWATPAILNEAERVSTFSAADVDIVVSPEQRGATFSSDEPLEELEAVRRRAEDFAQARNQGRMNAVRGVPVPGDDDFTRERREEYIARRNRQLMPEEK
jgi:hypothetical protein